MTPVYIYWYLLSLAFWRILLKYIASIRYIEILLILLALFIGLFPEADRFLSISRTICFFPYFYLGHKYGKSIVASVKQVRISTTIIIGLVFVVIVYFLNAQNIVLVKEYEHIQSYTSTGVGLLQGILARTSTYIIGYVGIVVFMRFVPEKEIRLTKYGSNTLCTYVLSALIGLVVKTITLRTVGFEILQGSIVLGFIYAILVCVIIMVITNCKVIIHTFNYVNEKISKWIIVDNTSLKSDN